MQVRPEKLFDVDVFTTQPHWPSVCCTPLLLQSFEGVNDNHLSTP